MNLPLELELERKRFLSRRWFFRECGVGLGSIALASATGLVGHVLADKSTGMNLKGRSVAALADLALELADASPVSTLRGN